MNGRKCGAYCIAPSIATAIPNMLASVRCANLTADNLCMLFDRSGRPSFCLA